MLKNLKARASSIKPKVTLMEFSQPPDCGKLFIAFGKRAKNMNGKAKAAPKVAIPNTGRKNSPPAEATKRLPTIGPVHEKETSVSVKAIKKTLE